jgi:hypothetical protein
MVPLYPTTTIKYHFYTYFSSTINFSLSNKYSHVYKTTQEEQLALPCIWRVTVHHACTVAVVAVSAAACSIALHTLNQGEGAPGGMRCA